MITDQTWGVVQVQDRFLIESQARRDAYYGICERFRSQVDDTPPVDPAGAVFESESGSRSDGRPLLIWRTTLADSEPSPAFGDPADVGDLPKPLLVSPVVDLSAALSWAVSRGLSVRKLRLSQPRLHQRWSMLQVPDRSNVGGSNLDRKTIGAPGGMTRQVCFRRCRLNDTVLRGVFEDCDFSNAMMFGLRLRQATFRNCRFNRAIMEIDLEGRVTFEGGEDDLTSGCNARIRSGHPADTPTIAPCYPDLRAALQRWRSDPDIKQAHRQWWWANLARKLTGRSRLGGWRHMEPAP